MKYKYMPLYLNRPYFPYVEDRKVVMHGRPIILATGRIKQEDSELETGLGNKVSLRPP
jgi:hypothetical protein